MNEFFFKVYSFVYILTWLFLLLQTVLNFGVSSEKKINPSMTGLELWRGADLLGHAPNGLLIHDDPIVEVGQDLLN